MKTSSAPLELGIDRTLELPVYLQICQRFKTAIAQGHLRAGQRVPAVRALAVELSLARGTVEAAYRILADEGYLQVRGAAGTVVSPSLPPPAAPRKRNDRPATPGPLQRDHDEAGPRPLQLGLPALDAFPRKVWNRLVAHRLRGHEQRMLAYPEPAGYRPLREHIATYLGLSRGVSCVPEQVFVTAGYRATLELTLRSLAAPDDAIWFEDPGYLLAQRFLRNAGVRLVPVPVDQHGMIVEEGVRRSPDARFALLTPSHQSPLGVTLSLERRLALLAWAGKAGSWIVEDDYDSEFRYQGRPLPALKSLDRDDRVIYCGTFSKVMFPGLRLSYVVAPAGAVGRFQSVCESLNAGCPYLFQASVADFIAQGHFSRHLKRMRLLYGERHALFVRTLREVLGRRVGVELQAGGLRVLAKLAAGTDDGMIAERARTAGLGIHALSRWYLDAPPQPGLLLGFANVADADTAKRLALVLKKAIDG
ncbi:PLP-dependent aminotransferase family protein [Herbaspirillum sp. RV1423]|uniref:MocR-like pyridoxine biosynthesis transcription factor PdxR n=1 Tax=Herbaspirillum sp. RV1423 TaxID=1443993 RepID=UPI0004B101BA|nr:PLP-dependent aminotransferase family protein [Herbaspirillum sp. RV1423]